MSKDFDTTLSDALDLASHAVHTVGPTAARIRGRKRTMRKRIALSATSLALVAVATTAAFAVVGKNSGTPNSTTGTPHVTVSSSPTGAPSASTSANMTPSGPTSSSSTPSGPAISNSAGSGSPSSSQPTAADPHHVVDAAWLTADQMPFASTLHWKVQPATWGALTATVFYYPKTITLQALTVCGDPANLFSRTIGAQGDEYFAQPKVSSNSASQFVFFFADAASAQQTFAWIQGLYGPSCLPGVTVTQTAGDGQTSATWLSRKGSTGPVDLAPYNREYFVLRGSTIGYVWMNSTRNLPTTYDDGTVLSTIASHLCVYGGPCS